MMMKVMTKLSAAALIDRHWLIESRFAEVAGEMLETIDASYIASNEGREDQYQVIGGTAVIEVFGPMTKADTSVSRIFGGCSTVRTRRMMRNAANDAAVERICLVFDSPGGQVSGVAEFAEDVLKLKEKLPIIAYIDNLCCSAALWVASQCTEIVSNPHALDIGSIGCMAVLYDTSKAYEDEGVKCILVSTGGVKGQFADGVPISDEAIADMQSKVDEIGTKFVETVAEGRRMDTASVYKLATGKTWNAEQAQQIGLVDRLATWDEMLETWSASGRNRLEKQEARKQMKVLNMFKDIFARADEAGEPIEPTNEQIESLASAVKAADDQVETLGRALIAQRLGYTFTEIRHKANLTPVAQDAFEVALTKAVESEGAKVNAETGEVAFGDCANAVIKFASSIEKLPLGESVLSSVEGAKVLQDADTAREVSLAEYRKNATSRRDRKLTTKSLGKDEVIK